MSASEEYIIENILEVYEVRSLNQTSFFYDNI